MKARFPKMNGWMVAGLAALLGAVGCETLDKATSSVTSSLEQHGIISSKTSKQVGAATKAMSAFEQFTPEQEYYIGRAVGANITRRYKVYENPVATKYVNFVGLSVARSSQKPETFSGYHFLILDSDEINAFAAPSGFIFITKGLLKLCQNEDDLAAVLAHEVGHVQEAHAIKAIRQDRMTGAVTSALASSVDIKSGDPRLAELTTAFKGSITDITEKMITSGYSQKQEESADAAGLNVLQHAGYEGAGLVRVLEEMDRRYESTKTGMFATHPKPSVRLESVRKLARPGADNSAAAKRSARFKEAMNGV